MKTSVPGFSSVHHAATTCSVLASVLCALSANAKDLYVSASGFYDGQKAETNLQAAINKASNGDTVWVENGFVCDEGTMPWGSQKVRVVIRNAVTVRSRSGDLENQPIIRGAVDPAGKDGIFGKEAVRAVVMCNKEAKLIGFRVEGGVGVNNAGDPADGGGIHLQGLAKNCVVAGSHGNNGGGIARYGDPCIVEGCIVTNNTCLGEGGGVFKSEVKGSTVTGNSSVGKGGGISQLTATDSKITGNKSEAQGGGFNNCLLTQCLVANNSAKSGGGGVAFQAKPISGCVISNNVATAGQGGGVSYQPNLIDCVVIGNKTYGVNSHGGGAQSYKNNGNFMGKAIRTSFVGNSTLKSVPGVENNTMGNGGGAFCIEAEDCEFIGNLTEGTGGGADSCTLINCIVKENIASNSLDWVKGCGGGISYCNAKGCQIFGNRAVAPGKDNDSGHGCGAGVNSSTLTQKEVFTVVDCVVSNNIADNRAGGIYGGVSYNCIVTGNKSLRAEGGGICDGTHYNDLVIGNDASKGSGAGWKTGLVNCTVTENEGDGVAVNNVTMLNTVVYGKGKAATGSAEKATNSCAAFLKEENGNLKADPMLGTEGDKRFLPLPGSPCINAGLTQNWMNDETSPGYYDLNGRRRIIGSFVDIGAFEASYWGTILWMK